MHVKFPGVYCPLTSYVLLFFIYFGATAHLYSWMIESECERERGRGLEKCRESTQYRHIFSFNDMYLQWRWRQKPTREFYLTRFFGNFFKWTCDNFSIIFFLHYEKSYFKVNRPVDVLLFFSTTSPTYKHTKNGVICISRMWAGTQKNNECIDFSPHFLSFNLCTVHVSLNYTKLNANVPGNWIESWWI